MSDNYDVVQLRKAIEELTSQVEGLTKAVEAWDPKDSVEFAIEKLVEPGPGRHRKDVP